MFRFQNLGVIKCKLR